MRERLNIAVLCLSGLALALICVGSWLLGVSGAGLMIAGGLIWLDLWALSKEQRGG